MLSVVVATRNDNHGGRLVERTNVFIQSIAAASKQVGLETELVFVDWNPPSWTKPLADVLAIPTEDTLSAKIVTVPKEIHDQLAASHLMDFYQMIAKNVGVRRSNGNWILCTNPDTVYTAEVFARIAALPEESGGAFYRTPRLDTYPLPRAIPDTLEGIIEHCESTKTGSNDAYNEWEHVHSWACGDFTLLHKDDWWDARGYPEFEIWSIHVDSLFLLFINRILLLPEVFWDDLGVFHPGHPMSWALQPSYGEEFPSLRHQLGTLPTVVDFFAENAGRKMRWNGENWGLADAALSEVKVC